MDTAPMAPYLVALTALGTEAEARLLVRQLVGDRVVACGTVVPGATSVFRWAGEVTETNEVIVLLKTRRERWSALEAAIRERHPYDVPELLALPVEAGLPAYLEWVATETSEAP